MKPRTLFFIGAIGGIILGLIPGYLIGDSVRDAEERSRSYDELKMKIRQRELLLRDELVDVKVQIETKDEGGLFNTKIVHYVKGEILNKSIATPVKDIKLKIDFMSGTNSVISSQDVTVYSIVQPYHTISFREKISPPEKTQSYQHSLIDLVTE